MSNQPYDRYHYIVVHLDGMWVPMHLPHPIKREEVELYQRLGTKDIIDITNPHYPKSCLHLSFVTSGSSSTIEANDSGPETSSP